MIAPTELAVRFSAALLPRRDRDRYREQWLGDLRDAPEAGIRAADIALGSLVYAITAARPLPSRAVASSPMVDRRTRLAAGLAVGAAVLAVTRYADLAVSSGQTDSLVLDFGLSTATSLLLAFQLLAPIAAIAIVTVTRGTAPGARLAIWMLALASLAPEAQTAVDWYLGSDNIFLSRGVAAYPVAAVLIVVSGMLLSRELRGGPSSRRRLAPRLGIAVAAAAIPLALSALALASLDATWAARTPLEFGGDGSGYANWLQLKAQGETLVAGVFGWFGAAAVAGCVAILLAGVAGRIATRSLVAWSLAALGVLLVAYAATLGFVALMMASVEPPLTVEPLLLIGRWILVAMTLTAVGGTRLSRRPARTVPRVAAP